MTPLLAALIWIVLALVVFVWYLCAWNMAGFWLIPQWWAQIKCRHRTGFLMNIDFDGTAQYQCATCAKLITKPLKEHT